MKSTCLSRAIVIDTRQQAGKHDHKHERWESEGVPTVRCKLPYGDYALAPKVSVDTKKDIYELAGNILQKQDHIRFRNECIGAKKDGCQLIVLVENEDGVSSLSELASWNETGRHFVMRKRTSGNDHAVRFQGERLAKACATMQEKYGVRFMFCKPEESADRIREILGGEE